MTLDEVLEFIEAGRFRNVRVVLHEASFIIGSDRIWHQLARRLNERYKGNWYTRMVIAFDQVPISKWCDLVVLLPGSEPKWVAGVTGMQVIRVEEI